MKLEDGKDVYDHIKIPKELDQLVRNTIKENSKDVKSMMNFKRRNSGLRIVKYAVIAAAAVVICFTVALNSNQAFAKGAMELPVIGQIAKVLTVRSYQVSEDNTNISVNIPAVELEENQSNAGTDASEPNMNTDNTTDASPNDSSITDKEQFVADFNAEIDKIVVEYLSEAEQRRAADKEAYIATGGTEEEWAERDLNITVDYDVKYEQGNLLSLVLVANESWYGAYDIQHYYNMNLKENKMLSLEDVIGENYKELASDSIIRQMKDRVAENPDYVYWGVTDTESGITGFTTVDENTKFYLNEEGKPVICFAKYEVAPGFMGAQEFVIE